MCEPENVLKQEINRRRREDGFVNDAPDHVWWSPVVRTALDAIIDYGVETGIQLTDAALAGDEILGMLLQEVQRAINTQMLYARGHDSLEVASEIYEGELVQYYSQLISLPSKENLKETSPSEVGMDSEKEEETGKAAAEFLAWHMNQDVLIQEFRRELLGEALLTTEEAWELLTSPLAMVLSIQDYTELGSLPLTDAGRFVIGEAGNSLDDCHDFQVKHDLAGLDALAYRIYEETDGKGSQIHLLDFVIEVKTTGGEVLRKTVRHERERYTCATHDPYGPLLPQKVNFYWEYPSLRELPMSVPFFRERDKKTRFLQGVYGTINSRAMRLAESLAFSYPIGLWDALEFLFTAKVPEIIPLHCQEYGYAPWHIVADASGSPKVEPFFQAHGPVVIQVQPWVGPETLANFWRNKQQITTGRHPLLPLKHNLDLFRFVLRNTPPGKPFQWQKLCQVWEEENGQSITRNVIQMTFKRTQEAMFPGFTRGGAEPIKVQTKPGTSKARTSKARPKTRSAGTPSLYAEQTG